MEVKNMEEARTAIQHLFEFIGIKQIFCVDDEYAQIPSHEKVIGLCAQLLEEQGLSSVPELPSIPFAEEEEIWKEHLRRLWDTYKDEDKTRIHRLLYIRTYKDKNDDTTAASSLEELLKEYELQELTPSQWLTRKSELLDDDHVHKTLLLFDRDLSKDPSVAVDGISLIQDAIATFGEGVICGLLSHTADSNQAYDEWCQIAKNNELDKSKFIFIPKDCLNKDLLDFAWMIKLAVLNGPCKALQEQVSSVIQEAHAEAQKKVEQIHIYDFEHIVFQASFREGIWEPDTLFRIFGLFHRVEVLKKARNDQGLYDQAALVRRVSSIPTSTIESPKHNSWKIRRLELYEEGDYINTLHMPLELGDIFERTSGEKRKQFILLAQPCDLMVRKEGSRHDAITEAIVAEIVDLADKKNKSKLLENHYELPYYSSEGREYYVSFRKRHTIKLIILDMCVFQNDGSAKIKPADPCSENIIPSWRLHYSELQEFANKAISKYSELQRRNVEGELLSLVIPQSSNDKLFKGRIDLGERGLSYDCQRVERLCQLQAAAMLTKFAEYLARAAFELDFGR